MRTCTISTIMRTLFVHSTTQSEQGNRTETNEPTRAPELLGAWCGGIRVVHGLRRMRDFPWYMTGVVRGQGALGFGDDIFVGPQVALEVEGEPDVLMLRPSLHPVSASRPPRF